MNTKEMFEIWLLNARKDNGDYYTERTQKSYFTAFCKAEKEYPFLGSLNLSNLDRMNEITHSGYYMNLSKNRQSELRSALNLYVEFLQDRESGWKTIAEFSEGKQFTPTSEFSLHVTYDKPFTVKELSGFLNDLDTAYKETLIEQGFSQSEAEQADLTVVKVSEGSLWFEIASTVIPVVMPIVMFVLDRIFKKRDEKKYICESDEKQINIHKKSDK